MHATLPILIQFQGSIPVNYGQFIEHEWIQARKKFMANTLPAFVEVCSCREANQTSAFGTRVAQTSLLQALKQSQKRGGNAEVAEDKDY